jgi:DNA ligase D-like protein (predicted polymerase)
LIYPDLEISKIQIARYYERIAESIVPHVAARPLTLVHCPAGVEAPCNFLKHAKAWGPSALRRVRIQEKTKVGEYLLADSIEAVVSLAQMGIVEIHTWNATAGDIDRPNRLVWDLDPGPQVSWRQVVKAAELVRDILNTLGLRSWVKTTGGRGLHVVVPLKRKRTVSECLDFSRAVSEALAKTDLYARLREKPVSQLPVNPARRRPSGHRLGVAHSSRTNQSSTSAGPPVLRWGGTAGLVGCKSTGPDRHGRDPSRAQGAWLIG